MSRDRPRGGAPLAAILLLSTLGCASSAKAPPRASAPSLRSSTVAVRVSAPEEIAALYGGVAAALEKHGQQAAAQRFLALRDGSFGSGFLVRQGGDTFVVTNRHVVELSNEASVSFDGKAGAFPVEVLYADRVYDLAVLAFSDGPPPEASVLELAKAPAHDLDAVVATGFPGLDGSPSYQITRGQISNERFATEARGQPVTVLQHTAPIDPGSSGGPLTNEQGAVVGVNTLKYRGRDNVYLAIPSAILGSVLAVASETKRGRETPRWHAEQLGRACGRLVAGVRGDEPSPDLLDLVTASLAARQGLESLRSMIAEEAEEERRSDVWSAFLEDPTRALRLAVALRMWQDAQESLGAPLGCKPGQDAGENTVRLQVDFERGKRETTWRFEQGAWKLVSFGPAGPAGARSRP